MANLDEDAKALKAMNLWDKPGANAWALVPQTCDQPVIVRAEPACKGLYAGKFLFFQGFDAYLEYSGLFRNPDSSFALSGIDIPHLEFACLENGSCGAMVFETGYMPRTADRETRDFLAPLVHECVGLLMRFEEDPGLPASHADERALFARIEGLDGKWRDGALPAPEPRPPVRHEAPPLGESETTAAEALPLSRGEAWELDLFGVPACRTNEPKPRILYLLAAVDAATGEKRVWDRMFVSKSGDTSLKPIWDCLGTRLLAAMIRHGRAPGAINIRTERVARYLRPLGTNVPFKLVRHGSLPALDETMRREIKA